MAQGISHSGDWEKSPTLHPRGSGKVEFEVETPRFCPPCGQESGEVEVPRSLTPLWLEVERGRDALVFGPSVVEGRTRRNLFGKG